MAKHDHKLPCTHEKVSYCKVCSVCHCADCGTEWGKKEYVWYQYPYTYYPYTTYGGSTIPRYDGIAYNAQASGLQQSLGSIPEAKGLNQNQSNDGHTVTVCNHGA